MTKTLYNVTFSQTSRNGVHGLRPQYAVMSADEIILAAERDMVRSGETLESIIGIGDIERPDGTVVPERQATDAELLEAAIARLSSDGRLCEVEERTPAHEAAEIEAEIAAAGDLQALADALNRACRISGDVLDHLTIHWDNLKVYGGPEPDNCEGLWSYDEDSVLVNSPRDGLGVTILSRADWAGEGA